MEPNQKTIKTLESLDNIVGAEAGPDVYEEVMKRISKSETKTIALQPFLRIALAAGVALLVTFSAFTMIYCTKQANREQQNTGTFAREYFSYLNTPQL
jgi:hypothetical protein